MGPPRTLGRMFRLVRNDNLTERRCDGWSARWRPATKTVTFRVPRRCLVNPQRGKVRMWVLSESPRYSDADDLNPGNDHDRSWLGWVRRG